MQWLINIGTIQFNSFTHEILYQIKLRYIENDAYKVTGEIHLFQWLSIYIFIYHPIYSNTKCHVEAISSNKTVVQYY